MMQQAMQQMILNRFSNNPMFQRAQQMVQGKSPQEVEQIAQNLCNQKGIDINTAYSQFQQQVGNMFGMRF